MIETALIEAFILDRAMNGASDDTIATYRKRLSYLARMHGQQPCEPLAIIQTIRAMTCRDATKAGYWRAARACLNYAMAHGSIPPQRMPRVRWRKPAPRVPPSAAEFDRLIGSIGADRWTHERNRLLLTLYACCGCRNSELRMLRRADVHLDRALIVVVGKGNKPRQVPLIDQAAAALRRWLGTHDREFVFPNARTGGMLARATISKLWRGVQASAGSDHAYSVHDLRHYCAALLRQKNVDLGIIGSMLGHSSIIVTEMVYGHLQPETVRSAVQQAMVGVEI
jgi:integrase